MQNKLFYKFISVSLCLCGLFFLASCNELEKPKTEPFYAQTAPPPKQEFRWSNGRMPKAFDPALASAPPESDIVRALYEGLTDTDPKTLETVPAVAARWSAGEDFKTWTFYLRKDAKWSNGESVTARDFVRSWLRLASLGEKVAQRKLLKNIVGLDTENILPVFASEEIDSFSDSSNSSSTEKVSAPNAANDGNVNSAAAAAAANRIAARPSPSISPSPTSEKNSASANSDAKSAARDKMAKEEIKYGVEAVDDYTLKVTLARPDKDFPALVAHPIFRPVYGEGKEFETASEGDSKSLNANIVTNGAFRVFSIGADGITLDRAEHFWDKERISLERVRFVPIENAEAALESYRAGEIDAVTNANFAPLALKLLTPFDDFRRITHSAVNFYEFNRNNPPFNDRRVREALSIAIERERLTEDEMDGATVPALSYLPFGEPKLTQDAERAKKLLAEAGFPGGENFPTIRLLVNRNDLQRRVARSVARMWEKNLGVKTEIVVKEGEEFETAARNGEYDLIRRGVVLPTTDETTNMLAMFGAFASGDTASVSETTRREIEKALGENPAPKSPAAGAAENPNNQKTAILTEEQALAELPAIPLYFPASYSLVKPYVHGFDTNVLDAPTLKTVRIDNNWQPPGAGEKSKRQQQQQPN
jgi:oligopeptide transport system substrate-binding protein